MFDLLEATMLHTNFNINIGNSPRGDVEETHGCTDAR